MQVIIFSAVAGICGTGLGGLISALLVRNNSEKTELSKQAKQKEHAENMSCWLLSFAAGIMTSIVCFGLMPEAVGLSGTAVSVAGLILGIVIIMALNRAVDKLTKLKNNDTAENLKVHHNLEELYHEGQVIHSTKILRSGIIMLLAIGLHNIPEGIAIGSGGSHNNRLGLLITVMIALHNIPEGMAVAAPMLLGGVSKHKAVFLTTLSGATTLLGGFIGLFIGNISDFAVAVSFAVAGGAMLYVVFGEIIPQAVVMTKTRIAPIITLFGIIIGLIITRV
jgi:ZIP family zinc transporter